MCKNYGLLFDPVVTARARVRLRARMLKDPDDGSGGRPLRGRPSWKRVGGRASKRAWDWMGLLSFILDI